jgi:SAM-dependent MidA family methyltransferase
VDPRALLRHFPEPTLEQRAHSARLGEALRADIDACGGWIAFDRYMQAVLYTPGLGYYAAGTRKLGDAASGGDFVTAPEMSPLFAQALAAQIAELFDQVPAHLLEFGAGSGAMAVDLIAALADQGKSVERYSIVEVSADLAERQRARLQTNPVEWLCTPPHDFEGVMIANEVLDVMPVQIFVKRGRELLERGVVWEAGALAWAERPAREELQSAVAAIEAAQGELPDGFSSELGLVAAAWMRSAGAWLARGALLVIDYGFPRREYYHPQRLMGTLMCHYRHHAHADPLWMPGLNDITAHIDFTAIADAAHGVGLEVLGYTTQAHFLLNCGLLDRLRAGNDDPRHISAAQRLLSEAEMGELFKVLAVGRGVRGLRGFVRGDRLHTL